MVLNFNSKSNTRMNYCTWKYVFLVLLISNAFLGCIYYMNDQKTYEIIRNLTTSTRISKTSNSIKIIENILANEYNHDQLEEFYSHVNNQYSLGLKCTRNETSNKRKSFQSTNKPRLKFHRFLIDHSDACANQSVDLVILIISKSDNYKTRDAIRRTWASENVLNRLSTLTIKYFFLIDFDEHLSQSIQLENDLFNDIIQVELPQQYTLVTHRVLSIFEWTFRYCYSAKYLFKSDDDIFFNIILLIKYLSSLINHQSIDDKSFLISDLKIYGYQHGNARVVRQSSDLVFSRYIITHQEYPCDRYPTYLSGYGYLISKKARDAFLYTAFQDPQPFRISDVYLTGIIPDYLSSPLESMSNYAIADKNCERFFNHTNAFACAGDSHHGMKKDVFQKYHTLWKQIQKTHRFIF